VQAQRAQVVQDGVDNDAAVFVLTMLQDVTYHIISEFIFSKCSYLLEDLLVNEFYLATVKSFEYALDNATAVQVPA